MRDPDLATFTGAVAWLRDRADGLIEAPARLHDHAFGEGGVPRYSTAFFSLLVHGPYATRELRETRDCPLDHPLDAPICERCGGLYNYTVTREIYRHPLAAALERLKHAPATSPDWPTPYQLVIALLHTDGSLTRSAELIGRPVLGVDHADTLEAAFLLAVRKLAGRYASGPLPNLAWTALSEAQQHALDAA